MSTPTRAALRWWGGKWRLAPWIIQHFPAHDAYVEPYGGAASVLLRKPPVRIETVNDLQGRLVNFFRVLRNRSDDLLAVLQLTPYAREEYEEAREPADDPVEDARRFYVLCWQGRGGSGPGRTAAWRTWPDPYSRDGRTAVEEFTDTAHLAAIATRLRNVQLEHGDALDVIRRYDHPAALHYIDPPYATEACDNRRRYAFEMAEDDHRALAELLHKVQGMVVVSGYRCPLYDDLYRGWTRVDCKARTDGPVNTESLWLSVNVQVQEQVQLGLNFEQASA